MPYCSCNKKPMKPLTDGWFCCENCNRQIHLVNGKCKTSVYESSPFLRYVESD